MIIFTIMKYTLFLLLSIISCKISPNKTTEIAKNKLVAQQNLFKKVVNGNNSYTLYYKVDENINTPVRIFTYYITNTQTKKIVKSSEQVAAEKMYWKDNNTIAIVPYTEMIQKNNEVGAAEKINEILINIK